MTLQMPGWMVLVFVLCICLIPVGAMFVGAWLAFRIKVAGTGFSLIPPGDVNKDEAPHSYVGELFSNVGESVFLKDEPLSDAAKRIREQMISKNPELSRIMDEVEGVS